MKLFVFSVYDKAVMAFLPPFYGRSVGEALRSFMEACGDEKHQFSRHASDYVLFKVGEFDDGKGIFASGEPERVVSALECLRDVATSAGPSNGSSPVIDVDRFVSDIRE